MSKESSTPTASSPGTQPASLADAEAHFASSELGLQALHRVNDHVTALGPCDLRVARTQVGWARRRGFAFLWEPGRWLAKPSAEIVLTIALLREDDSPRWKQVTQARPGLFVHHLEVHDVTDVDPQVERWLAEAFDAAG